MVARKDELYGHPFHIAVLGGGNPGYYLVELPDGPTFELRDFNEYVKAGLLDEVNQSPYNSYTLTNFGEAAVANDFQETGTLVVDLQLIIKKLQKSLNHSKEREAKYGGNAPPELWNEIEDHEKAIYLARQVLDAASEFQQELGSLNIDPDLKARLVSILGEK